MKKITKSLLVAGVAALALTTVAAKNGHGTDILHLFLGESMSNTGIEAGTGSIKVMQATQGNANNQKLDIVLKGLAPNTTYSLAAALGDSVSVVPVANTGFTTDGSGNAVIHYRKLGNGHGGGHNSSALPADLTPVSNIRELDVVNSTNSIVLSADFTSPSSLQYLVKRDISSNGVSATLRIHATTSQTQFQLNASGLAPTNTYQLAVNDTPVQSQDSDANGKLSISSLQGSLDILDVHSVALWDASSNVVVSTTLP